MTYIPAKVSKVDRTEDSLVIQTERSEKILTFTATGGPDDPLVLGVREGDFSLSRAEVELFQSSLLNFLNTGYFDQEG